MINKINLRQATLLLCTSIFLSGCSLFGGKPAATPAPTPMVEKLTPDKAPFTTLTITADEQSGVISGHTFTMSLSNLNPSQNTLEYVLLYDLPDGRQQGIPGSVTLGGKTSISRNDLLMGSCSKTCRFDDGVTKGTIEITYRDASGNATGDALGNWHLQSKDKILSNVDDTFEFEPTKTTTGWFVTMTSFGLPSPAKGNLLAGPYTVTSSVVGARIPGTVTFKSNGAGQNATIYLWDGSSWQALTTTSASADLISATAPNIGTFVLASAQ